jgi:hypothetical protein
VVCSLDKNTEKDTDKVLRISRVWLVGLWGVFFLTYTILFGKRLQSWEYNTPGHCYNAHLLAGSTAQHPHVDNLYIGITCWCLFASLCGVGDYLIYGRPSQQREKFQRRMPLAFSSVFSSFNMKFTMLYLAFLQFPLHAYSVIMLRISNESLLTSGNVEQEWGFGQVSAMVLLAPNLIGLIAGVTGEHLFSLAPILTIMSSPGLKTLTNMAFKNISTMHDVRKMAKLRKGFQGVRKWWKRRC